MPTIFSNKWEKALLGGGEEDQNINIKPRYLVLLVPYGHNTRSVRAWDTGKVQEGVAMVRWRTCPFSNNITLSASVRTLCVLSAAL